MNKNIMIVPASPEDIVGISDVFYTTWLDTYPNEEFGITVDDIEDRYKNRLSEERLEKGKVAILHPAEGEIFLVAKDEEKVIGVCRGFVYEEKNEIRAIYILKSYQRNGVGKLFWEEMKKRFNEKNNCTVNVAIYNMGAIEFYKKLGFVDTGKRFKDERFAMKSGALIPEMEMVRVV